MKLTSITPQWEFAPLNEGWTGYVRHRPLGNGLTLVNISATKAEGAGSGIGILPAGARPSITLVGDMYPSNGVSQANALRFWINSGGGVNTPSSSAQSGRDYQVEIIFSSN